MSIQVSDAVNIKKIINDKDSISILLIFAVVILLVKTRSSEVTLGALWLFIFWRGLFLYRKDTREKELIDRICTSIITDYKENDSVSAWLPISKNNIKKFTEADEIIDKCWEKLVNDGYVFFHDETKEYMFNRRN